METKELRKVYQGVDGYKTKEGDPATPEEIQAWHDQFCGYCGGGGSLHDKKIKDLSDQCKTQLPCPGCNGTGYKEGDQKYHQHMNNVKVVDVGMVFLNPETYCPYRKVVLEFDYCYVAQQDGRPPRESYTKMVQAYQLGKKAVSAILKWNQKQAAEHKPI